MKLKLHLNLRQHLKLLLIIIRHQLHLQHLSPGATKIDDIKKGVTVKKQPATKPAPLKKKSQSPAAKKEKKTADVSLTPVDNVNPHSAEWEEEVNHSVTNVHESSKHYNTAAQLQMLNSIR